MRTSEGSLCSSAANVIARGKLGPFLLFNRACIESKEKVSSGAGEYKREREREGERERKNMKEKKRKKEERKEKGKK